MSDEQLRVFLTLHAFFHGVSALAAECEAGNLTKERLADRVIDRVKKYEAALKGKEPQQQ
jgi:hypothetical protein